MCVSTGWGSTGKWNVKFFDTPGSAPPTMIPSANEYNYSKNVVGQIGSAKRILITVLANNDAHIALGADSSHNCAKYEIVIGGWNNSRSALRNGN